MNTNPIGIFDSGLGGLTVVKAIQKLLPHESVIYFGDTARLPYGNKSPKIIKKYSLQIADFLISKGAKIIVIACNTASALALNEVQKHVRVPVVDVVVAIVSDLNAPATVGLVDRVLHAVGHPVGVHDDVAIEVAGGSADGLDQRDFGAQKAFLVGIEDRDQRNLRQVQPFA